MTQINTITTNMLREQTYILHDETKECVIIDPGFYSEQGKNAIDNFIATNQLVPVAIYFTHLHLDHIMGAQHIIEKYSTPTYASALDLPLLQINKQMAMSWGIDLPDYNLEIKHCINDGDVLTFGQSELKALHVPGHSPGSIVFYSEKDAFCIGGDVLFQCSVGRSDLWGGDEYTLLSSIRQKILTLPEDTTIFPGHGHATTVGDEKRYNPYLALR